MLEGSDCTCGLSGFGSDIAAHSLFTLQRSCGGPRFASRRCRAANLTTPKEVLCGRDNKQMRAYLPQGIPLLSCGYSKHGPYNISNPIFIQVSAVNEVLRVSCKKRKNLVKFQKLLTKFEIKLTSLSGVAKTIVSLFSQYRLIFKFNFYVENCIPCLAGKH